MIFVGEDLDVLMELSDRIMVLCGGEVSGILDARKTDKNEVGMLMTRVGGKEHEGKELRAFVSYRKKRCASLV